MSGTGSLMIRNLRKASDYDKARMNQDELLKIAIANDNNIANARRSYKQGEVPPLTTQQTQTPDEIQADLSKNYSDAITNLISLGMDYREASEIVARLGRDPTSLVILNNTFPSIKADFQRRFDVKRITPTGFLDFFDKFREVFEETKGIADNSTLFNDKFDRIINNINDLRAIVPTRAQLNMLEAGLTRAIRAGGGGADAREVLDRLRRIERVIPPERFFEELARNSDNTRVYRELARLQDALDNLPSRAQVQQIVDNGAEDNYQQVKYLVEGISDTQLHNLQQIQADITGRLETLSEQVGELDSESERVAPYLDRGDTLTLVKNKIFFTTAGERGLQPLGAEKMKSWYKSNNNNFREFYDNVIGTEGGVKWGDVKQYILQTGTRRKVGDLSESPGGGASKSPSKSTTTSEYSGVSSAESGIVTPVRKGHGITVRKIGRGISPPDEPTHIQFGKHLLHANNLRKSVLSIHHKKGGRVASIPVQHISEDLRDFIVDILHHKKASQKEFNRLPIQEQKLFEKFATGAGVFHSLGLNPPQDEDDKKNIERFEVLRGEWMAGNNSHELVRELRKLVIYFMDAGRLTKSQGRDLLLNIN